MTSGFVLRKMCSFCSFQRPNRCKSARKTRMVCTRRTSDFLCFQPHPSFVPTIFVFSRKPPDFCQPDNLEPWRNSPSLAPPRARTALECSDLTINVRISHSIAVRFSFVFQRSSFVFKHFLASFPLFFIFVFPSFALVAGFSRQSPRVARLRRSSPTRCPQNDHHSRLSYLRDLSSEKCALHGRTCRPRCVLLAAGALSIYPSRHWRDLVPPGQ
jgi:hypothetical protein